MISQNNLIGYDRNFGTIRITDNSSYKTYHILLDNKEREFFKYKFLNPPTQSVHELGVERAVDLIMLNRLYKRVSNLENLVKKYTSPKRGDIIKIQALFRGYKSRIKWHPIMHIRVRVFMEKWYEKYIKLLEFNINWTESNKEENPNKDNMFKHGKNDLTSKVETGIIYKFQKFFASKKYNDERASKLLVLLATPAKNCSSNWKLCDSTNQLIKSLVESMDSGKIAYPYCSRTGYKPGYNACENLYNKRLGWVEERHRVNNIAIIQNKYKQWYEKKVGCVLKIQNFYKNVRKPQEKARYSNSLNRFGWCNLYWYSQINKFLKIRRRFFSKLCEIVYKHRTKSKRNITLQILPNNNGKNYWNYIIVLILIYTSIGMHQLISDYNINKI